MPQHSMSHLLRVVFQAVIAWLGELSPLIAWFHVVGQLLLKIHPFPATLRVKYVGPEEFRCMAKYLLQTSW